MVVMEISKIIISTILITPLAGQSQSWITYTVRSNETLSSILYRNDIKPIYGLTGTLNQTIALNPELRRSMGNKVFPGQKIRLPREKLASFDLPKTDEPKNPVPLANEDISNDASATFSVSAGVDFMKIQGVDETTGDDSVILSEANPSLSLGFNLLWDQVTALSLISKVQNYKLQDLNNGQSFDHDNGNKIDLSLKLTRKYSERWTIGAGVAFEQDLFFHAISPTELGVDKVMIAKPGFYARYVAMAKSNANVGFDGRLGVNLPNETSVYKIKTGAHAGAGTYFKYHTKILNQDYKSIEARVFYSIDNQDTSVTTRKLTNLSFMLLYDWRLPW